MFRLRRMGSGSAAIRSTSSGVGMARTLSRQVGCDHPGVDVVTQDPARWWGRHLHEMRCQAELARLLVDPVYLGRGVPRGDGRPVVLIPGFLAGDGSLTVMAEWLGRIGYRSHGSGILWNVDCSDR